MKETIITNLYGKKLEDLGKQYLNVVNELFDNYEVATADNVVITPKIDVEGNIIWALKRYTGVFVEQVGSYNKELYESHLTRVRKHIDELETQATELEDEVFDLEEERKALAEEVAKLEFRKTELKDMPTINNERMPKGYGKEEPITVYEYVPEVKLVTDDTKGVKKENKRVKAILNKFARKSSSEVERHLIDKILKEIGNDK